jgi:hypothetical protein
MKGLEAHSMAFGISMDAVFGLLDISEKSDNLIIRL